MKEDRHIEIRDGTACLHGRNLKAKMVARLHLWENRPVQDVMAHYDLSAAEVHAALAFYYDNQAQLDAEYEANMRLLAEVGESTEAFRAKIEARKENSND